MRILYLIIPLIQDIAIVYFSIKNFSVRKYRYSPENRTRFVFLDPGFLLLGLVAVGILSVPVTIHEPSDMSPGVWWLFESFIALYIIIYAFINISVEYNDSEFIVSNIFGKKRVYSYDEITEITATGEGIKITCGQKKIVIDAHSVGWKEFVEHVEKRAALRDSKETSVRKSKFDPLNGNVRNPWIFFIMDLVFLAASLFFFGFSAYKLLSHGQETGAYIAAMIFDVLTAFVSAFGIIVARHPERYPAWLCKKFVGEWFWAPGVLEKCKTKKNNK